MKVIFAPHPDDEIIGCYEILNEAKEVTVIHHMKVSEKRLNEIHTLPKYLINVKVQLSIKPPDEVITDMIVDGINVETIYFPDPYWELHPEHKDLGNEGYKLWKNTQLDIVFYSTNMNTPYLHELGDIHKKRKENILNAVYPSQADLWKYEKKYIFFEGRIKYLR